MSCTSLNEMFLSLTNILSGNHIETGAIVKAMELLCTSGFGERGLLYEADLSGQYCLSEYYASNAVTSLVAANTINFSPLDAAFLVQSGTSYVVKGPRNTPLELQLLTLYAADSLVVAPVLDNADTLHGLILLIGPTAGAPPNPDMGVLTAALSLLIRYVEVRMYQHKLSQAQLTMESILDNTGIDIYVNDFYTHEILYVNKSMAAPYGGQTQLMGHKCWQVLFPGQAGPCEFCPQNKIVDENGIPNRVYTWDYQRPFDGSWFRVFSAAFRWVDGRLAHVVSSADITDNKRNEALIENMANYDQLTKLPNRRMLVKECERRIDNATATEQGYVLFFDIDGFKSINDSYGHDAGDEFLIQLGSFFSSIPLLKNAIYRNGGDEFVAIIGGEAVSKDNISSLASFIHKRFRKPWILEKGEIFCNTSIGVACFPEDGVTVGTLLQKADMAMYQVKKSGGGGLCFGYQLVNAAQGPNVAQGTNTASVYAK